MRAAYRRGMRVVIGALVVVAVVACGARPLAVSVDGRGVLRDAYDGKLDRRWSCGSLRAAYRRLPPDGPIYSAIPGLIAAAAAKACDAELRSLHTGATERQVAAALGAPDRTPRCWLYRWPPSTGSVDGARICFSSGRATLVQTAVHG